MRRIILLLATTMLIGLAACTPTQVETFLSLSEADQAKVVAELQRQQAERPQDCYSAMERVFPPGAHAWARGIIQRESGNDPGARNSTSVNGNRAHGCWQLMLPLHSGRFAAAGCSASQWADPTCNTRAAYELYRTAGTSPWRL